MDNPFKLNRAHQLCFNVQMMKSLEHRCLKHFQIRWRHKYVRKSGKQG